MSDKLRKFQREHSLLTKTVFIRIGAPGARPNFENDQYIISVAENSDGDSIHEDFKMFNMPLTGL